jgi:DNA uptake protein ComE-like DNA-binding protein
LISFGQEKSEVVQQRIEFIAEQLETEEIDLTNIIEQLNYYFDHPLNLNSALAEELEELNLLSSVQINDLLLHRKAYGKFISIYELQSLEYWDLQTIQLV